MKILTKLPSFRPCNIIGKYALHNKEELKHEKISEEYEITGIGKKCLKLNEGIFISWDEIDDSLDTLVDGEELSSVMTTVLEFFLPKTNDEWEKHLGGRIPLPSELAENEETEEEYLTDEEADYSNNIEKKEETQNIDPELCFIEVGEDKKSGERGYRLNKKVPIHIWKHIKSYFNMDYYNNNGWVTGYTNARKLEKELGITITIQKQREQKEQQEHLEKQAKKLNKYIEHFGEDNNANINEIRKNNTVYYSDLNKKRYIITEDLIYEFDLSDECKTIPNRQSSRKKIKQISKQI